jgi:hypothetical protein
MSITNIINIFIYQLVMANVGLYLHNFHGYSKFISTLTEFKFSTKLFTVLIDS